MHDSQIFIREEGVTSPREPEEEKKKKQNQGTEVLWRIKKELVLLIAQLNRD